MKVIEIQGGDVSVEFEGWEVPEVIRAFQIAERAVSEALLELTDTPQLEGVSPEHRVALLQFYDALASVFEVAQFASESIGDRSFAAWRESVLETRKARAKRLSQ